MSRFFFDVRLRDYLMNGDDGLFSVSLMDLHSDLKRSTFQEEIFGWLGKTPAAMVFPVPEEKAKKGKPLFGPGIKDRQDFRRFITVTLH